MKKLSRNSTGFGAVEAVLIIVVVALIGGVGWYVWQKNKKEDTSKSAQTSTGAQQSKKGAKPEPAPDPFAGWKSYSRYGITFKYPADWTLTAHNNTQSTATELKSPDLDYSETVRDAAGAVRPKVGARINVSDSDQSGYLGGPGLTADTFENKSLKPNVNGYKAFKAFTVNGQKVVQYQYGGTTEPVTLFFLPNGNIVNFHLDYGMAAADALVAYNQIVGSVIFD